MPIPSRFAASIMSSGAGLSWHRTIASIPASVHTAIALRWFCIVIRTDSSPQCPITSERRSEVYAALIAASGLSTTVVPPTRSFSSLNVMAIVRLKVVRLKHQKLVSRGDIFVAFAAKAARSPATENSQSASVQTRATSSMLCASEERVTA